MISDIDEALRSLIRSDALGGADVEVVLDAPTKEWAARRNAPTIDVYLYDIREDLRRRERGWVDVRGDDGALLSRRPPPRHFKMSYLVTAWTQRPEDEHRLLSALLQCFLRYEALPPELVVGTLAGPGVSVPIAVGLPPPEDRGFADVWSSLGGELKPSLDVVVTAPVNVGFDLPVGPPVLEGPFLDLTDRGGGAHDARVQRHSLSRDSIDARNGRAASSGGRASTGSGQGKAPPAAPATESPAGTRPAARRRRSSR